MSGTAHNLKSSVKRASSTASRLLSLSFVLFLLRPPRAPCSVTSSTSCLRNSSSSSRPFKLSCISALSSNLTSPSSVASSGWEPGWKSNLAKRCMSWLMALLDSERVFRRAVRAWVVEGIGAIVARNLAERVGKCMGDHPMTKMLRWAVWRGERAQRGRRATCSLLSARISSTDVLRAWHIQGRQHLLPYTSVKHLSGMLLCAARIVNMLMKRLRSPPQ